VTWKRLPVRLTAPSTLGCIILLLSVPLRCPTSALRLNHPTGKRRKLYKKWCAAWLEPYPSSIRGFLDYPYPQGISNDLYYLRCGVVHQGRLGHDRSQYSRIVFTLPNTAQNVVHLNIIGDALNLDIVTFCRDMINAASRWYSAKQNDPHVQANLPWLVQYREQGLASYIVGMPLIG
jgi:hypothetical protein